VSAWKVSTCVLDIYQHSSLSSHPSFVDFHQWTLPNTGREFDWTSPSSH